MIKICPRCNRTYVVGFDNSDFIHVCNSQNKTLDEEDVVVNGNWEDYTGSGIKAPQTVMMQGIVNEFFGTKPDIEGEDKEKDTPRGRRASTHRSRQHLEFINLKGGKNV
jgi:hypothetical protein